jgi:hypothetical protein
MYYVNAMFWIIGAVFIGLGFGTFSIPVSTEVFAQGNATEELTNSAGNATSAGSAGNATSAGSAGNATSDDAGNISGLLFGGPEAGTP